MTVNPGLFAISQEQVFLASEPVAVVHPKMKLYSVIPPNLLDFISSVEHKKWNFKEYPGQSF